MPVAVRSDDSAWSVLGHDRSELLREAALVLFMLHFTIMIEPCRLLRKRCGESGAQATQGPGRDGKQKGLRRNRNPLIWLPGTGSNCRPSD